MHFKKMLAVFLNNRNFVAWKMLKIPKECSFSFGMLPLLYMYKSVQDFDI